MSVDLELMKKMCREKQLFIVEDDDAIRSGLTRLFGSFFGEVYEAADGLAALDKYHEHGGCSSRSLILTDIRMPRMNGLELIEAIKQESPDQKIIAFSASDEIEMFVEAIRLGVDRFVIKPLVSQELLECVGEVVQRIEDANELARYRRNLEESKDLTVRLLEDQEKFLETTTNGVIAPLGEIRKLVDDLGENNDLVTQIRGQLSLIENQYNENLFRIKKNRQEDHKEGIDPILFGIDAKEKFGSLAASKNLIFSLIVGKSTLPTLYFSRQKLERIIFTTLTQTFNLSVPKSEISMTVGFKERRIFISFGLTLSQPLNSKDPMDDLFPLYGELDHGDSLSLVRTLCEEENVRLDLSSSRKGSTTIRFVFPNWALQSHDYAKKETLIATIKGDSEAALPQGLVELSKGYVYNAMNKTLLKDGSTIYLTQKEREFIDLLMTNLGRIVTEKDIKKGLWGTEMVDGATIRSLVNRLRQKTSENFVQNIRGQGYKLSHGDM